jgi:hypothetical protein
MTRDAQTRGLIGSWPVSIFQATKPVCCVPLRRRFFLVQSRRQFVYSVVIILGGNMLLQLAAFWLSKGAGFQARLGAHIGTALGSNLFYAAFLWESFPHRMFISGATTIERLREQISLLLCRYGYRIERQTESETMYVEALPAALTWKEANVSLTVEAGGISLVGGGLLLKLLFRRLRRMQSPELRPHQ